MIGGMSVPTRGEAAALLLSLSPAPWQLRHSRAVAEVAAWLAARTAAHGVALDRRLVETAALLHDADKALPVGAPERALAHGRGSAAWLAARGHPELAPVVADHPVTRLADADWFDAWLAKASPEALIVAYADKRAGQHLEAIASRLADWRRRYPVTPDAGPDAAGGSGAPATGQWTAATVAAVEGRARILEMRVCELAGVAPADVSRLAWTGRALARARRVEVRA